MAMDMSQSVWDFNASDTSETVFGDKKGLKRRQMTRRKVKMGKIKIITK